MARWLRCLLAVSAWICWAPSWADDVLSVALEPTEVDISAHFSGAQVKAIGSKHGPGDLIVKVAGPPLEVTLARKAKFGPFWIGGETVKMAGAPGVLFVYATAPISSVLSPAEREKYGLLLEALPVRTQPQLQAPAASVWRAEMLRLKQKQGYYREHGGTITVAQGGQFAADINLPSDLQTGTYTVETLLVRSGKVVGRADGEFKVRLVGTAQWIWNVAHDTPWLFGSLFTLAAMLLGAALTAMTYRRS